MKEHMFVAVDAMGEGAFAVIRAIKYVVVNIDNRNRTAVGWTPLDLGVQLRAGFTVSGEAIYNFTRDGQGWGEKDGQGLGYIASMVKQGMPIWPVAGNCKAFVTVLEHLRLLEDAGRADHRKKAVEQFLFSPNCAVFNFVGNATGREILDTRLESAIKKVVTSYRLTKFAESLDQSGG